VSLPRVLVVGATGAFGRRLAAGLARDGFALILAARDGTRLAALREQLAPTGAQVETLAIDQASLDAERLAALKSAHPDLFAVADAAGPFQGRAPALPRAAIAAGLHCVDLADARDYVLGIRDLDEDARRAGAAVLSGASSTPALSHAVLDRLTAESGGIYAVDVAIAPGNRAPRGLSLVRAILSWAGHPVGVFRGGRWVEEAGWGRPERVEMDGVGSRWLSLCETPDLDLLVERYRPTADATFRAGLELGLLHGGLYAASGLVRLGLLRSLAGLAWPLKRAADLLLPFGTDRGGMRVEAVTRDRDGALRRRVWTLVAEAGDGPQIPPLPALAALKMLASGELAFRGAAPCAGLIPYERIAAEFAPYRIRATTRMEAVEPLFRRALGGGFDLLPPQIRAAHEVAHCLVLEGRADVAGPSGPLASLAARLFGLPREGRDLPVRVEMRGLADGSETWERTYPGVTMRSRLVRGIGPGMLEERFGPLEVRLAVSADRDGLTLETTGARLLGLPLPRMLAPASRARESVDGAGRFTFDVPIHVPLLGRLSHYRGWLAETRPKAPEE
jgi:NAD(P)-dependent dehydrogenase (short-subunit alcohol dehydrogenase family)